MFDPYKTVLTNPQSYLCGLSSGLLFLPTTVGGMIWGVAFLRQGWHIDYAEAVNRASMIPLGWVIGSPVLGYIADHFGRRKPGSLRRHGDDAGTALWRSFTCRPTACRRTCPASCSASAPGRR